MYICIHHNTVENYIIISVVGPSLLSAATVQLIWNFMLVSSVLSSMSIEISRMLLSVWPTVLTSEPREHFYLYITILDNQYLPRSTRGVATIEETKTATSPKKTYPRLKYCLAVIHGSVV